MSQESNTDSFEIDTSGTKQVIYQGTEYLVTPNTRFIAADKDGEA